MQVIASVSTLIVLLLSITPVSAEPQLFAATLPNSRAVQVGEVATAFATIINAGDMDAEDCLIAPRGGVPIEFSYVTTDAESNLPNGPIDTPVDIAAEELKSVAIGMIPTAPIAAVDVAFDFVCANAEPATVLVGVNTLQLLASLEPVPDIVAVAATLANDVFVSFDEFQDTGIFVVATTNLGIEAEITVTTDFGGGDPPVSIELCQTDPVNGNCLTAPATSVTTTIGTNATPTFGFFLTATGVVESDPAVNRAFVRFSTNESMLVGGTSVALRTDPCADRCLDSSNPKLAANGGFVVFESTRIDLVADDTNQVSDVFRVELASGEILRVNLADDGRQSSVDVGVDDEPSAPAISADGRYVAFASWEDGMVTGDDNGMRDILLRDVQEGDTTVVSLPDPSAPGDAAEHMNGFGSRSADISDDGRIIAFESFSTNLVPGDTNNTSSFFADIFVRDRAFSTTTRVNVSIDGVQTDTSSGSVAISGDSRFVAFSTDATTLTPDDNNATSDVFVHDLQTGVTKRVSVATYGVEGNAGSDAPALSADGRFVAFSSVASNLVSGDTNADAPIRVGGVNGGDIFVHDRQTVTTERVSVASDGSEANGHSQGPAISADGRFVAFVSEATNLVANDTNVIADVFVHDRQTGTTERVSLASDGSEADISAPLAWLGNRHPDISADGRLVVFDSYVDNLVVDDEEDSKDIFLHDRQTGETRRLSVPPTLEPRSGSFVSS